MEVGESSRRGSSVTSGYFGDLTVLHFVALTKLILARNEC